MSIIELIHAGTLDEQTAAFLWIAMEHRASIIVAATPHEAGKTTMLTALLDFVPPDVELIYLRGWYERFEFLEQSQGPSTTYLLSNEISSHLPIYMWGRGVRQMFEAASAGFGFGTTVHAASADEVLRMLENYPLEVPPSMLTEIDLIVTLSFRPGTRNPSRRVMRVEMIEDNGGKPAPRTLASRDVLGTELQVSPGMLINALVRKFGIERERATNELARRVSVLQRLRRSETFDLDAVRQTIHRYYNEKSTFRS
jgi:hypothetical protein